MNIKSARTPQHQHIYYVRRENTGTRGKVPIIHIIEGHNN